MTWATFSDAHTRREGLGSMTRQGLIQTLRGNLDDQHENVPSCFTLLPVTTLLAVTTVLTCLGDLPLL
jgi:hypothetical protein